MPSQEAEQEAEAAASGGSGAGGAQLQPMLYAGLAVLTCVVGIVAFYAQ